MSNSYTGTATAGDVVGIPANILTLHLNDLLFEAMPKMKFDQFAVVRNDLLAEAGDTISFSKYGNLTRGGSIDEDADLDTEALTKSTITIQVTEYGKAVGLTKKLMTLSFLDEMEVASIQLGRDYAEVMDLMLRDAVFSTTQTQFANERSAQKDILVTDLFALTDVDRAVETLETASIAKYTSVNGEFYASYAHVHQLRNIKSSMISIRQYAYAEMVFRGELGEYNGVRFISSANCPNGAAASSHGGYDATLISGYDYGGGNTNSTALYKAVIFGENAYGWATALPVELREDDGNRNFGRKIGLAWYAITGAGKINNENGIVLISG